MRNPPVRVSDMARPRYGNLFQPEIKELIDNKEFSILKEVFGEWRAPDLAELIADLPEDQQPIIFRLLPRPLIAEAFEYLDIMTQKKLLTAMGKSEIAHILNDMSPDDRTRLLEELPSGLVKQMLELLSPEEMKTAQTLLGYPDNSIGRLMTPDYIAVKKDMTVGQVLAHIRKSGKDSETLNMVYVVDEMGRLVDDISIRQVLLAQPGKRVESLMDHSYVSLKTTDDQEEAVLSFRKYHMYAIPVVDAEGILIGIVTIDDVLHVAEQETTEDMHKMGGMEALDGPYLHAPLFRLARKRATWLVALFLGEMMTATAMGYFEGEIARAVVLALFVPLIISSGGNSGSQASTLVIRAMAIGEIRLRDWWRVFLREIGSGLILGAVLAAIGFLRIAIWQQAFHLYGAHWILVATVVAITLVGVVLWGSLMGSMLPFILKRLGADPATSSAPFVATLVDVSGILIYFNVAYLILKGIML
jgi:magnesium transporter